MSPVYPWRRENEIHIYRSCGVIHIYKYSAVNHIYRSNFSKSAGVGFHVLISQIRSPSPLYISMAVYSGVTQPIHKQTRGIHTLISTIHFSHELGGAQVLEQHVELSEVVTEHGYRFLSRRWGHLGFRFGGGLGRGNWTFRGRDGGCNGGDRGRRV